jgi:hypothetical protein
VTLLVVVSGEYSILSSCFEICCVLVVEDDNLVLLNSEPHTVLETYC